MPRAEEPSPGRPRLPIPPRVAARLGEAGGWALLAGAVAVLHHDAWALQHPIDDAYISYRYAENLVAGHGLVYNAGEYVEGFTNLLWTLLVALGVALGLSAPFTGWVLGQLTGALALGATLVLARGWLPASLGPGRPLLAGLAPWLLIATPAFPRWSLSGLETPLFVACVTAALAAFARRRLGLVTALALLATLTRPDGALLAAVLLGLHLLRHGREGLRAWRAPALYAAGVLALTLFRLAYYGSPLPNTFYAKVGGIPWIFGVHHVRGFLAGGVGWLLLPGALAVAREPRARPAALYALAVAGYVVWIGGDVFAHRFLLPVLPALAALAVRGCWDAFALARRVGGPLAAAGALALAATLPLAALQMALGGLPAPGQGIGAWLAHPYRARRLERAIRIDRGFEARAMRSARVLRERGERPRLVAAGAIGAFGYFSRLRILDLYGLVDPTIARSEAEAGSRAGFIPGHQRTDADYVMARRPDYILMPRREPDGRSRGLVPAHDALWDHPDLDRWYEWDDEVPGYRRRAAPRPAP